MKVKSILQYFWPALSDNLSGKPIFGLHLSGHLRQVLLYIIIFVCWKREALMEGYVRGDGYLATNRKDTGMYTSYSACK